MGTFAEYEQYDAVGLGELVRKKKVKPSELCEEAIERIEKINPSINAVIHTMYDGARESARGKFPHGPFSGVPFLLKDHLSALAGEPLTAGCRAYRSYVPGFDSTLVRRFKESGVNIVGKTNCPELALLGITEPELHGATRNPWNTGHTPGGSSGGSAAAVASGMVPMASGGDGGGSIRIPSSHCGLFGLKPTRGRNPLGPLHGRVWQGAVVEGVISRSVRDSAAMLDATEGNDAGAPDIIPRPGRPYLKEVMTKPGRLRIGFSMESPIGTFVHPECKRAVADAAVLLSGLGHRVEEARPGYDGTALAVSYITMYFGEVAAEIDAVLDLTGRKPGKGDFEITTWILGMLGRVFPASDFVKATREWDRAGHAMGRFFQDFDLYLTPTVAYPPVKIGELRPKPAERIAMNIIAALGLGRALKASGIVESLARESLSRTPFTQLANLTGLPAMSVPFHMTGDGLPVGIHFTAPACGEAILFRLAAQLEKAKPWFDTRPVMP